MHLHLWQCLSFTKTINSNMWGKYFHWGHFSCHDSCVRILLCNVSLPKWSIKALGSHKSGGSFWFHSFIFFFKLISEIRKNGFEFDLFCPKRPIHSVHSKLAPFWQFIQNKLSNLSSEHMWEAVTSKLKTCLDHGISNKWVMACGGDRGWDFFRC